MKNLGTGFWLLLVLILLFLAFLLSGCALFPGATRAWEEVSKPEVSFVTNEDGSVIKRTTTRTVKRETRIPFHAPCGFGITIGNFPIVGLGSWNQGGCLFAGGGIPDAIVYNYYGGRVPAPVPPGAFPLPPQLEPQTKEEEAVHGAYLRKILRSTGSDPREVSFRNETPDPLELMVGRDIFKLAPYGSTGIQTLDFGIHPIRLTFHRETFNPETGEMENIPVEVDARSLNIRPDDTSRSCVTRGESGIYSFYCRELY